MISLIAAIGKNRALGNKGALLWNLPRDMKYFRETTKGHTVIMGSRTFESIGHALPVRRNIVFSDSPGYYAGGCEVVSSVDDALKLAGDADETFVIGGGQIYTAFLPFAHRLYLTHVEDSPEADVFFPEYNQAEWRVLSSERFEADAENPHAMTFTIYEKK